MLKILQRLGLGPDATADQMRRAWLIRCQRLGLGATFTPDELRTAWRRFVRMHHPDRNPGDHGAIKRFQAGEDARGLLEDEDARDAFLEELYYREAQEEHATRRAQPGIDLEHRVILDLELCLRGGSHIIDVDLGVHGLRRIKLPVPEGMVPGGLWRIPGRGGAGTPPGDLVIVLGAYAEHELWTVDGDDLRGELEVTLADIYEGRSVEVPTPWAADGHTGRGLLAVKLPPANLRPLRLRGQGVRRGALRGDLILELRLELPRPGDAGLAAALRRVQPSA